MAKRKLTKTLDVHQDNTKLFSFSSNEYVLLFLVTLYVFTLRQILNETNYSNEQHFRVLNDMNSLLFVCKI